MSPSYLFVIQALKNLNSKGLLHVNDKLICHLQNTYNYLKSWGNKEALCLARLYHAVYSTDGYDSGLIDINHRSKIVDLIGKEAENIVYYYAACDRQSDTIHQTESSQTIAIKTRTLI